MRHKALVAAMKAIPMRHKTLTAAAMRFPMKEKSPKKTQKALCHPRRETPDPRFS
jgi:hypothetical protein